MDKKSYITLAQGEHEASENEPEANVDLHQVPEQRLRRQGVVLRSHLGVRRSGLGHDVEKEQEEGQEEQEHGQPQTAQKSQFPGWNRVR
jgi:hypothetical protein